MTGKTGPSDGIAALDREDVEAALRVLILTADMQQRGHRPTDAARLVRVGGRAREHLVNRRD